MRLTEAVRGVEGMLRRLIGEDIEILFSCPKASEGDKNQGWSDLIFADPGLIEQVIVNLAVNARDAMPDGGKLFIEIAPLEVTEDFGAQTPVAPGRYVSLTVSDTGTGMSPEVQARIFEPFFTTKQPGKGTGLGLSTVYGIVKQSDGFISVHSTPGLGASFRVLFPASAEAEVQPPAAPQPLPARGTETILLVEDEAGVRHYVRDVLEACGYRVLDAVTGADALEIAKRYKGAIDLLITDLVLPGMNGAELIRECRVVRPGIATMRMSGYPERAGAQMGDDVPHLQKPFSREALLRRVREVLDRPGPAAARA
jgi:CheY-like chemotaxis protein